jgi:tetratricopeptide (TPR) repeat protein
MAPVDFREFPCNLSFWMALDQRFHVRGDWVDLADRIGLNPFAAHYVDPSLEVRMADPDLELLEKALAQLFEKGEARPARQQLLELKLRYPGELLLFKFLYQSAYFLEEEQAVLAETEAYSRAYPADPDPWRTRAEVFFHQGDYEASLEAVRQAEGLAHPDDWGFLGDLYLLWMFICWETGDRDGAWSMACRIRGRDPENGELARFLEETGLEESPPPDGEVIRFDFRRRVRLEKNGERKT